MAFRAPGESPTPRVRALAPAGASALLYLAAAVSDFYLPESAMAEHKIQSGGGLALEVESPLYNEVKQEKAGSEVLRPRWALVPRRKGEGEAEGEGDASVDWLAMAPFGFKLPWGTTAHELGPADLPIGALSAERAAALEARAAAKAEEAAAAAAAAEAKAAAKAEKAAEKAAAAAVALSLIHI